MLKHKFLRPCQQEQTTLLPPSPSEWLSEEHQVYFLLDLMAKLDLTAFLIQARAEDPRDK